MTTGIERLHAVASGAKADCIPVFCNMLDQGAKEFGISPREYYASGERVAEAQLRMNKKYGYDNVWSLFYVGKEAELLGCRSIVYAEDGPPNVGHKVIETYDDVHRLQVPNDVMNHPAFEEVLKCLRILRSEVGGRQPICAYVTASMTLPALLMGIENWLNLLLCGPAEVRDELLVKCSDFFRKQIEAYRNAGADVLVYSNPFGSTDLVPMRLLETLSLPWMVRDLEPGGTRGVVYYCGSARIVPVMERVMTTTGISTYYLGPLDDIRAAKRIGADRALCAGVINDIRLIDCSPEAVRKEVKRIIELGMPGGRFFFGTVLMPYGIPDANIRAMMDAAREYGALGE